MAVSATATTTTITDATATTARVFNYLTDAVPPAKAFRVRCDSGSAVGVKVRIPHLHGASGTGRTLAAGDELEYVCVDNNGQAQGYELYIVAATAGTATYSFEISA